jgi:hypothetical protein
MAEPASALTLELIEVAGRGGPQQPALVSLTAKGRALLESR